MNARVRKPIMFGFLAAATLLVLSSAAFACTVFRGKMTLTVTNSAGVGSVTASGTSVAEGNNSNMGWCSDPRTTATGPQVDGATAPAQTNNPPDDATVTVELSVEPTTCNGGSQLNGDSYVVSWHPSLPTDCMVQGLGTPAYVDPKLLAVSNGSSTGTVADRTYTFPAVGYGPEAPGDPVSTKYAGVCVTRVSGGSGVLDGNRAPIRVI